MFDAAFASIATSFSQLAGGPFVDAVATWQGEPIMDAGGSIVSPGLPLSYACKAQFDAPTQQMREAEGFQQTDVRILVLATSIGRALDTSAGLSVADGPNGGTWALVTCQRDPAGVGYECRGRRISSIPAVISAPTIATTGPTIAQAAQLTGWAAYVHTGDPQAITANIDTALTNNAGSVIETQKPTDIASFYDGAVITGRIGDSIMAGVEFTFTPSDGVASMLSVCIDIGGAIGKLYVEEFPITNGAEVPHRISYHPPAYTLDTWQANGGTVTVRADGPGVVTATRYVIHRLHKAR